MEQVSALNQFDKIKTLADPRRLRILRLLLAGSASLTQLGLKLNQHPARIRHHMQKLEQAGLVEISSITVTQGVTEKFYKARAGAYLIQQMVLPEPGKQPTIIFSGSHDLGIEQLGLYLAGKVNLLNLPVGSLDGLVALRQGLCHIAGSHLLDEGGQYNIPFVQHLFPDRQAEMLTLAYRQQGLLLAPGNPKHIVDLTDLTRPEVTFINRQPGSGTRLWLDSQLKRLGITSGQINGYAHCVNTHTEIANAILSSKVDVGLGLQAAALRLGLSFVPMFTERYDLTLLTDHLQLLAPLLDHIQTRTCRLHMADLGGYETTHTGEKIFH